MYNIIHLGVGSRKVFLDFVCHQKSFLLASKEDFNFMKSVRHSICFNEANCKISQCMELEKDVNQHLSSKSKMKLASASSVQIFRQFPSMQCTFKK